MNGITSCVKRDAKIGFPTFLLFKLMKITKTYIFLIILLILISSCLLGCQKEKQNIVFYYDTVEKDNEFLLNTRDEFLKKYPNLNIEMKMLPFYTLKPTVMQKGAESFDILLGPSDWSGELIQKGLIQKVSKTDTGILRYYEFPVFYFYKEHFKGKKIPENIEQIFDLLGKGFMYDIKNMYYHLYIASFFESKVLEKDSFNMLEDEFINSVEFIRDRSQGNIPESLNYDAVLNMFASGKLSIILDGVWNYKRHIKNGASILPVFPKNIYSGKKMFFISKKAKHKEISREFIDFILSKEKQDNITNILPEDCNLLPIPQFADMKKFWSLGNNLLYNVIYRDKEPKGFIKKYR
ncbi:MAG: hypothetical protein C0601_06025 [Candidatus Muiribacterium halophilum]|uniref:ABC transporter substrate-binding protein n=1 Tax=Muiribacterium halophilum TaxID=2053465 RepID=A0A2N5ZH22_MUIH1|nr:MAG: hypothetical protein C0601_06025 [Candidatus Muirbacterium halophilum]